MQAGKTVEEIQSCVCEITRAGPARGRVTLPIRPPAPTSLPCDGGGVDVQTGKFPHFLFRQCTWISLIYSQFLVVQKNKARCNQIVSTFTSSVTRTTFLKTKLNFQ